MDVRVFVIDDHELVRRGLREVLTETGRIKVVGEAGSAGEALLRIPESSPQVVIVDVRLPDGSGIEVCRKVRSQNPAIRVLVLTGYDDPRALAAAARAGASGFILKQIRGPDLAQAVHRVAAGENLMRSPTATEAMAASAPRARQVHDGRIADLTPQEERVLDLIVEGLTNRQIGQRLSIAEKTVKNHVTSLMAKLHVERRTQAAVYGARVRGLSGQWP